MPAKGLFDHCFSGDLPLAFVEQLCTIAASFSGMIRDPRSGCGCSSAVEHDLAKVGVASSILVIRSTLFNDLAITAVAPKVVCVSHRVSKNKSLKKFPIIRLGSQIRFIPHRAASYN